MGDRQRQFGPWGRVVGRDAELAALEAARGAAARGDGAAAAVIGEPGIGKTHLLRALAQRAADEGLAVIWGRGSEFEREIPFGITTDAFDEPLSKLTQSQRARLGAERIAELGAVLPSLDAGPARLETTLEVERYRFHQAVRRALELIAEDQCLLVILDDLHWADPASVELVAHLVRRPIRSCALVIAFRPGQAAEPLPAAIEGLARDGTIDVLQLPVLTLADARVLLADVLDASEVAVVHAESGGNPFYLEHIARGIRDQGAQRRTPRPVSAAVAHELARLSAPAAALLKAASVLGEPFELPIPATVAALDQVTSLRALDELVAADLVHETGDASRFVFRHPIVRRAVYDSTRPGWRLGAHRRAAEALARIGAPIGVQAHHVERCSSQGDEQAIELLTGAAAAAAPRAPAAAARWLAAALALLPDGRDKGRELALRMQLATAQAMCGRLHESRDVLVEALARMPPGDRTFRTPLISMIAHAEQGLGRAEAARSLLTEALGASDAGGAEAVRLRLALAESHLMMGEWERAMDEAAAAHTIAVKLGEPALVLSALAHRAWVDSYGSGSPASQVKLDDAATGIDRFRDEEMDPELIVVLAEIVHAEIALDRFERAAAHAERGVRLCRATGNGYQFLRFTTGSAIAAMCLGRLADAAAAAEVAYEGSLALANDQAVANAHAARCWIALLRGDLRHALDEGTAGTAVAARMPRAMFAWMAYACHGEARIEAGEAARGRDVLLHTGPHLEAIPTSSRPYWQRALVAAEIALARDAGDGSLDRASEIAAAAERLAAQSGLPSREGHALAARAMVLAAQGRTREAADRSLEAAARFASVGMRLHEGRERLAAGQALAHAGRHDVAERELLAAHDALRACGAERYADHAAKELRALGIRVGRRRERQGSPGARVPLSEREQAVAELVAKGYTNRKIAAELYISEKTVEKHLAKTFEKLEVSSRAEVAATIERQRAARWPQSP